MSVVWEDRFHKIGTRFEADEHDLSDAEWEVIESPAYAFYQVDTGNWLPMRKSDREAKIQGMAMVFDAILKGSWNATIPDWMCELLQNAFDRDATECKIRLNVERTELEFSHNGEGVRGPRRDSASAIGDIAALTAPGVSGKRYDLYSEGRFGIGFKYWVRHFENATIRAEGFELCWDKLFNKIRLEHSETDEGWTTFKFTGGTPVDDENGDNAEDAEDALLSQLGRLLDAVRMRGESFTISYTVGEEERELRHQVEEVLIHDDYKLLSCTDDYGEGETKYATLLSIRFESPIFTHEQRTAFNALATKRVALENEQRVNQGFRPMEGEPENIAQNFMQNSSVILGMSHEVEGYGSLLSMFPITHQGTTPSRISFSAPFDIQPDRLNLVHPPNTSDLQNYGMIHRNHVLVHMLFEAYGKLLEILQTNDDHGVPENVISHIINNPPGESESELDLFIKEYLMDDFVAEFHFHSASHTWNMRPIDEIISSDCWPTKNGNLETLGVLSKSVDSILLQYREHLLESIATDPNLLDDLVWLDEHIDGAAVVFGEDEHGCAIPVENWLLRDSSDEHGFAGVDIQDGGEEE